jgi:tetratricopeptide (TPR) repeat protein
MFQLAQIHRTLGHAEKALSYQLQGLKIANRNLPQFIALAHILKDVLKDGQKVLAAFAGMRPSNQTVQHLLVARLLYEIEEYGLALVVLDQSPVITDETWYRRGQTLLKLHRYSEALQCFRQITGVSPIYTRCVQDMVLAGWLNTPPVNAGELIQPQNFSDPQLYQVLQSINNQLFAGGSAEIDVNSVCLQRIVGMLLSLNEVGPVLKIMALCGLEKPNDQIVFLTNGPAEIASACLAAKLALLEIKRGNVHPDFFYVLSWYLFLNDELKTSQDTLRIAASLNPESSQYRNLLQAIYQRQLEKMVLAALERYPDNRQLNHRLIVIKVGSSKDIRLKGAY